MYQDNRQVVYDQNQQYAGYEDVNAQYAKVEAKNDNFLQWFLNTKRDIENLKFLWRGYEEDNKGLWYRPKDWQDRRMMNEKGIHWAVSLMHGYLSRVYQYTNLDQENMNYLMRKAYRVVWWGLASQFEDFYLTKINTQSVANQILSQIHVILLSSRGNGIRDFLTKTHHVQESRIINPNDNRGFFSGFSNIFKRNEPQQQQG